MKTYLFESFNRYKRFSESLDVKAILCNKAWWVFNDSGEKEVYIFQEDGSLIISLNGRVTVASWQYISANKSLIISSKEQSYMLHPTFKDNVIFALQVDGTEQYSFMIDESQCSSFQPKSFSELQLYFQKQEEEEKKRIGQEQNILLIKREEEIKQQQIEAHREKREKLYWEAIREWEFDRVTETSDLLKKENKIYKSNQKTGYVIGGIISFIYSGVRLGIETDWENPIGILIMTIVFSFIGTLLVGWIMGLLLMLISSSDFKDISRQSEQRKNQYIQRYISKHIND